MSHYIIMKRKILFGAVLAVFTLLNFGCSKDEGVSGELGNNYLKVKVDGVEKIFANVSANWVEGGNYLMIIAMDQGKESLMINVMSEATRVPAGEYHLDGGSGFKLLIAHNTTNESGQVNSTATDDTVAPEDSFDLKIDKINNNEVEGTFSGVLVRTQGLVTLATLKLTEGSFKTSIKPN